MIDSEAAKRLGRMLPDPLERLKNRRTTASDPSGARCGCCPACHEFVTIELTGEGDAAPCPRCGQRISYLDPLGTAGAG